MSCRNCLRAWALQLRALFRMFHQVIPLHERLMLVALGDSVMLNTRSGPPLNGSRALKANLHTERLEDRLTPAVLDLTTLGASGMLNGAFFVQFNPDTAAGSGVINSFVRVQ